MIFQWPDKIKIDYVWEHFKMCFFLPEEIERQFSYGEKSPGSGSIKFNLSEEKLSDNVVWINKIPLLFPIGNEKEVYAFIDSHLEFHHDILKSAFYLLSGYQEYNSIEKDHFNRFPFSSSIQKKHNIATLPVVNYYFHWIAEALNAYAEYYNLPAVKQKTITENGSFSFFLSHDVDRVNYYTANEIIFRTKQLLGLSPSKNSKVVSFKLMLDGIWNYLFTKKNPAWDFEHLISIEKKHHIPATYFFLDKDLKHQDAYYDIRESRIKKLITWLKAQGAEVGLHGVCRSSTDEAVMRKQHQKIRQILNENPAGVRQHRLMYRNPETLRIHEKLGFLYDTTLGFAGHEGFRNAFCRPFKLFDHENNRTTDLWEFPLNVMDVTLFYYQNYNLAEAKQAVQSIVEEVRKFNGLFTILWHNGFNDERKIPGITKFYEELIRDVIEMGGEGIADSYLIKRLEGYAG